MLSNRDFSVLDAIFTGKGEYSGLVYSRQSFDMGTRMRMEQREREAIAKAEEGDWEGAKQVLSDLIQTCPTYASAYNNRAQCYRALAKYDQALEDLDHCISLEPEAFTLRQAHMQRGIARKQMGRDKEAEMDFVQAAQYGSEIAKQVIKDSNPYAKMCNYFVQQAIKHSNG